MKTKKECYYTSADLVELMKASERNSYWKRTLGSSILYSSEPVNIFIVFLGLLAFNWIFYAYVPLFAWITVPICLAFIFYVIQSEMRKTREHVRLLLLRIKNLEKQLNLVE